MAARAAVGPRIPQRLACRQLLRAPGDQPELGTWNLKKARVRCAPMRLLTRYQLRECLTALVYCFGAFLMLWIAFDLFSELRDLQESRLRGIDIVEHCFFRIPEFLPVAVPVALLLALLCALTNHARHNEITAMRAAGVSLWRVTLPYLALATLAALALFFVNEYVSPKSGVRAEEILTRRVQKTTGGQRHLVKDLKFHNSRPGEDRHWHAGIYNPRTAEMHRVHVLWTLAGGAQRDITAERAVYTNGVWVFHGVRELRRDHAQDPTLTPVAHPVLRLPEFTETPEEIRSEIDISERFRARASFKTRRADLPIGLILDYLRLHPNPRRDVSAWLRTKLHGRIAGPLACVVVVVIAVPFAARSGRRNVFVGVAASIVIFFAYYLLQQLGFAYGEAGGIPPWVGAWLPNILFTAVGLWMMVRVR